MPVRKKRAVCHCGAEGTVKCVCNVVSAKRGRGKATGQGVTGGGSVVVTSDADKSMSKSDGSCMSVRHDRKVSRQTTLVFKPTTLINDLPTAYLNSTSENKKRPSPDACSSGESKRVNRGSMLNSDCASVDVAQPWACKACTFLNHAALRACEICHGMR